MSVKQLFIDAIGEQDAAQRIGHAAFQAILALRKGDPAYRLTEASLIEAIRPALAKELPKAARIAGRNVLFDALAAGCGLVEPFTASASGQVAKALKEIRTAFPSVSAEELTATAKAVRRKFEDAGPMAVSRHFADFSHARRKKDDKPDVYKEPVGWKTSAEAQRAVYGGVDDEAWAKIVAESWLSLGTNERMQILRAIA
jgi:hypothetical protein